MEGQLGQNIISIEDLWNGKRFLGELVVNRSLKIVAANQTACDLLEYTEEELDEKPLAELCTKALDTKTLLDNLFTKGVTDRSERAEAEWITAKGKKLSLLLEFTLVTNGNYLLVSFLDHTDCLKKDEQIDFLGSVIDTIRNIQIASAKEMTQKKMLQHFCSYLHRRRKYRAVWIVIISPEGKVSDFAESGLGLFPMEEITRDGSYSNCIQQAVANKKVFVTNDPIVYCNNCTLASIFGNTSCMTARLELLDRFYGVINVHLSPTQISQSEQDLIQSVSKDISLVLHSYEVEETRKEAEKEKEKARKMKSDFIALASHQLRTPLTTLREGISILLDELAGELNEEQRDFILALKRNSDRIDNVVSSILTLQKIETGMYAFNMQKISLEELFFELEPPISRKHLLSEIVIKYQIEDSSLKLCCDKEMITLALRTILTRIIQVTTDKEILIAVSKVDQNLTISFITKHTTIIKEDKISFFQQPTLSYRLSHKSDQMMIDMAICHEIIKHYDGHIAVDESNEQGITVITTIPLC